MAAPSRSHQPVGAAGWLRAAAAATAKASHGTLIALGPNANDPNTTQEAHLVPAGHLGARKAPVVLDIRDTAQDINLGTVGITARAGRTGQPLWSKSFTNAGLNQIVVTPEPIGANGTRGVVIDQFTSSSGAGGDSDEDLTITAYSGVDGHVVWSQTFDGVYDPSTEASSNIAVKAEPFRDATHKAIDFLVPTDTSLGGGDEQTQGYVVSGVDGSVTDFGGSYTTMGTFPAEAVVPDLNHDGFADVVIDVPNAYVQALSGVQPATVLWSDSIGLAGYPTVTPISQYSHKTVPDIAFSTIQNGQDHITFTVLSGVTGNVLWIRQADDLLQIHAAGPNLTPAVLLATRSTTATPAKDTETWHYSAISATNKVLYSKSITASVTSPGPFDLTATISTVGDVNGDGSIDVHATLDANSATIIVVEPAVAGTKPVVHPKDGIINGRNGDFHAVNFQNGADGSLHKGAKTDLLAAEALKGQTRLVARHGSTRAAYYTRTIHTIKGTAASWATGIRLTGHACSDIALAASTKAPAAQAIATATSTMHGELAVLTARGVRLWVVTFPTKDATGGTLTTFTKPKHYCL
jgi:hypothetical protein